MKHELKTKRLLLKPMTDAEIEALIACTQDEELKKAYGEMLDGCKADPEHRVWFAPWSMVLKHTGESIGDLDFKGPPRWHAVELGYGICPAYEGQGYTTEAVKAMTEWAFRQTDVYFVEAETDPGNKASQRVLEKCGFLPDGTTGEEGPRFVLEAPQTSWATVYMLFGMSIGTSLGSLYGNIPVGMCLGICAGLGLGALFDASAKKQRETFRNERLKW